MTLRSVAEHARETAALLAQTTSLIARAPAELASISDPTIIGRVVAEEIRSRIPLPPFTNSQMDGYAVREVDIEGATPTSPVTLPVGEPAAAGAPQRPHRPGTASPVMTGSPLPEGAELVVPVEHSEPPQFPSFTQSIPCYQSTVSFSAAAPRGQFVRVAGEDLPPDSSLVSAGMPLTPSHIGLLASAGVGNVPLRPRPRILLITTGDELTDISASPRPGQIFDANGPMLQALFSREGAVTHHLRCPDKPQELWEMLMQQGATADLIVTSGGISMGAFEVVREALGPHGVGFYKVAMQPGGPQGLGMLTSHVYPHVLPVLCFPGNPVSSLLSAKVFLSPWLRQMRGVTADPAKQKLAVAHEVTSPESKLQLRRGTLTPVGTVHLTAPGSHLLSDLADAELIAEIPTGVSHLPAGSQVDTWRIND